MAYTVDTFAYCGMRLPHGEFDTYQEARDRVKARIKWLKDRMGCEVNKLSTNEWEICEPETCFLVPDYCGYLKIQRIN